MAMHIDELLEQHLMPLLNHVNPAMLQDVAMMGAGVAAASFALRTLYCAIGRATGTYDLQKYYLFPRLPWRPLFSVWTALKIWHERVFIMGKRSTGGFASTLMALSLLYKPAKVLLGRVQFLGIGLLQPIGTKIERHLFMYAMTGAGKTTKLITIISCWVGSVFVIDPKAQITNALFQHDKRRWFVLDPYGISNAVSASFNAIDCLKAAIERGGEGMAVVWANRIAFALIITPEGSKQPYFTETARGFVVGLILHVITYHDEDCHHLPFLRMLIVHGYRVFDDEGRETTSGEEAQQLLLKLMMKNAAFNGTITGGAAAMLAASGDTGGNVKSTLMEQTKWLDIPSVRDILLTSSMPLADLKTRDDVVFSLTAPVYSIREELSPLCRLLTNTTAYTFEAVREKKGQCLTVIDELPSQGHNAVLEVKLAVARSYGQIVLGISQNTDLMKKEYPKTWAMFSGEADAVYWMATNHEETAEHLHRVLGKRSLVEKDPYSGRKSYREVDVMSADQVKRYLAPDSGNLIVTRAGGRALKLKNEMYFNALPVWKYAADPEHKEALLRRLTRFFFHSHTQSKPNMNAPDIECQAVNDDECFEHEEGICNERTS